MAAQLEKKGMWVKEKERWFQGKMRRGQVG